MDIDYITNIVKASWKKEAAMMGMPPAMDADVNAIEIERAFMDQAYNYVQSKAGPLLKPEYRLGFEVVYKNDKNTRMVGIFAFRVDNELLFIPVFFVSSNIKGTDLLYRSKTKLFVPLTEDWCDNIISNIKFKQGELVDQTFVRQDGLNLDKIIEPPQVRKFAKKAYCEMLEKLLFEDETENSIKLASFLKEAGKNGLDFVKELMDRDDELAEATYINYGDTSWIPDNIKKSTGESLITIKLDDTKCASSELETFYKQGFIIQDKRAAVNKSVKALTNFKEGVDFGPTEIMDQNMNVMKVILFNSMWDKHWKDKRNNEEPPAYIHVPECNYKGGECCSGPSRGNIYDLETKQLLHVNEALEDLIIPDEEILTTKEIENVAIPVSDIKTENAYLITTKDGCYGKVYFIKKVSNEDNVYRFETINYPPLKEKSDNSGGLHPPTYLEKLIISDLPEASSLWDKDIYCTKNIYILPVTLPEDENSFVTKTLIPFDSKQLHNFFKYGSKTEDAAKISYGINGFTLSLKDKLIKEASEFSILVGLVKECNLNQEVAQEIIDVAKEKASFNFLYEKAATSLKFTEIPDMDGVEYDSIYNVLSENIPQIEVVEAEGNYPEIKSVDELLAEEKRLTSASPLFNMHPMEIAEISDRTGVKSIFDHGVIASLSKTFDSKGLIDNYLPDLEIALDKLGRLLFLFYWKPEDFMELYGTDDQTSLENSLVSNFKSFGELVLELKNKNQQYSLGSSPLPS